MLLIILIFLTCTIIPINTNYNYFYYDISNDITYPKVYQNIHDIPTIDNHNSDEPTNFNSLVVEKSILNNFRESYKPYKRSFIIDTLCIPVKTRIVTDAKWHERVVGRKREREREKDKGNEREKEKSRRKDQSNVTGITFDTSHCKTASSPPDNPDVFGGRPFWSNDGSRMGQWLA